MIECENGDLINLIRANYGRFSITICNDHGNVDWSVNCMSPKSLRVLHAKCAQRQNCSVLASTATFGDPCPGTHKYLEAHYQCVSAAAASTTTNRPSPPWLKTSQPIVWSTSTVRSPVLNRINLTAAAVTVAGVATSGGAVTARPASVGGKMPGVLLQPAPAPPSATTTFRSKASAEAKNEEDDGADLFPTQTAVLSGVSPGSRRKPETVAPPDGPSLTTTNVVSVGSGNPPNPVIDVSHACGPSTARNLFWNVTRVGEVNVQPCPGGATGIAKWRCVALGSLTAEQRVHLQQEHHQQQQQQQGGEGPPAAPDGPLALADGNKGDISFSGGPGGDESATTRDIEELATWYAYQPDLTQCRSLWLNNLEVRVQQPESSLISIANDLAQVTSSKTLYGGDMLVATKIVQTMAQRMHHDIETIPDQRQREALVFELLNSVVKTGSNLLDRSQHASWLDLSVEDQMRVATSLLTGLEDSAFLLADTILREKHVVQKVKNILISIRVLETRNFARPQELFPDSATERWQVSSDQIELPKAALIENSEGGLVRIVFVAFDRLEQILRPQFTNIQQQQQAGQGAQQQQKVNSATGGGGLPDLAASGSSGGGPFGATRTDSVATTLASQQQTAQAHQHYQPPRLRLLNSKVISASLGKGRHIQLSQPIRMVLRHLRTKNVSNPTCVFWNYIDHAWSEDGCHVERTNQTHTVCVCNHLTNFALLVDALDETQLSLLSIIDDDLKLLIYVSVAILIVIAVVALFALKLFGGVFTKLRHGGAGGGAGGLGGDSDHHPVASAGGVVVRGMMDRSGVGDGGGLSISGPGTARLHHHHHHLHHHHNNNTGGGGGDLHHPSHHHLLHHHHLTAAAGGGGQPPPGGTTIGHHHLLADDFQQQAAAGVGPTLGVNNLHNHHANNLVASNNNNNHHLVTTTFNNLNGGRAGGGSSCSPSPPGIGGYEHHQQQQHPPQQQHLVSRLNNNQQHRQQQQQHHQQQQQPASPAAAAGTGSPSSLQQQQYHHHHQPEAAATAAGAILLQGLGGVGSGGPPPASSLIASTSLITLAGGGDGAHHHRSVDNGSSSSDRSSSSELGGALDTAAASVGSGGHHHHLHQGSIGSSASTSATAAAAAANACGTITSSASSTASASAPLLHHHQHLLYHHHLHHPSTGPGADGRSAIPVPSKRNI
ncbi:latrophilin Cirl-like [Anopheles cruzii]|uniref:latrophilin Cirl-like n=1 Tax=Anopheles cruzii TaxID=68878 RepID=UPI0022EC5051|nr:latrophilin Cirl-like [Anopheles cruzii]